MLPLQKCTLKKTNICAYIFCAAFKLYSNIDKKKVWFF